MRETKLAFVVASLVCVVLGIINHGGMGRQEFFFLSLIGAVLAMNF